MYVFFRAINRKKWKYPERRRRQLPSTDGRRNESDDVTASLTTWCHLSTRSSWNHLCDLLMECFTKRKEWSVWSCVGVLWGRADCAAINTAPSYCDDTTPRKRVIWTLKVITSTYCSFDKVNEETTELCVTSQLWYMPVISCRDVTSILTTLHEVTSLVPCVFISLVLSTGARTKTNAVGMRVTNEWSKASSLQQVRPTVWK